MRGQSARRLLLSPSALAAIGLVIALAIVPPLIGGFFVSALTSYLIFGLLALSVGLITGYGRLFNLGVGANFGISAYAVAIMTQHDIGNPFVLLFGALLAGLIVSLLFAFYAVVSSGTEYLMLTFLTTLAFSIAPLTANDFTGGDNGLSLKGNLSVSFGLNPLRGYEFYWFVLGVVALTSVLSWFVITSQTGRAIVAIGRNPQRAAAMGYNVALLSGHADDLFQPGRLARRVVVCAAEGLRAPGPARAGQLDERPGVRADRRRQYHPWPAHRRGHAALPERLAQSRQHPVVAVYRDRADDGRLCHA